MKINKIDKNILIKVYIKMNILKKLKIFHLLLSLQRKTFKRMTFMIKIKIKVIMTNF